MNSFLVWFGILPVAAFLLLGTRNDNRKALWGALALGAFEAGYSIAVAGLDYLTVTTFLILAVFIGVSLRTRDDFFFKIHGAVTNMATAAAMLGAWYFLHKAMLLDAAEKYIGLDKLAAMSPEMNKEQLTEFFRVLSLHLPVWLVLHGVLTIHAAARWSRWAWALIYVPGLFAVFILAALFAQITALQAP
jgi:intracellular septation protein A